MADNRVQIVITTDASGAVTGLRQVQNEESRLGTEAQSAGQSVDQLTRTFQTLKSTLITMGTIAIFEKMASMGVAYNRDIENVNLGIAALLAAQGRFLDAQGQELEGREKINAAYSLSASLVKQLEVDNLATAATMQQLARAFQQALGPGLAAGLDTDQIRRFTVSMVQAASALTVPLDQLGQEVRSILMGDITSDSLIGRALGMSNADIKQFEGNAQGLFDFLMKKLSAFGEFGIESQKTYAGLLSNAKDMAEKALGLGTRSFFEDLKRAFVDLSNWALKVDAATGTMTLNPELVDSVQLLNDVLRAALGTAGALVKVLGTVATGYAAVKSAAEKASSKSNYGVPFTGISASDILPTSQTLDETRLEATRRMMANILAYQEKINQGDYLRGWPVFSVGVESAKIAMAETLKTLIQFREQMAKSGQDTAELDAFLQSLGGATKYVSDQQGDAAAAMDKVRYVANNTLDSLDKFKKHLQEIASINLDSLGNDMAKSIESLRAKIDIALKGGDVQAQGIEAKYRERTAAIDRAKYEADYKGAAPEIYSDLDAKRAQADLEKYWGLYYKGVEDARKKDVKASRTSPVDIETIDKDIDQFRERINKFYQQISDLNSDYEAARLEASGQYYAAEEARMNKKVSDQKAAFAKEVSAAETAYREMQQKLEGKKGSTPEAQAAVADLARKWTDAKNKAREYDALIDRNAAQELEITRRKQTLQGNVELAQTNQTYMQLTGSMRDQYQAEIDLINASEAEKLANVNKDIPGLAEAYTRLYAEQRRVASLNATGSFGAGFWDALDKYQRTLPTMAQQGAKVFDALTKGIGDAADALADFTMTGKMDFSNFANSVLKDILKIEYEALLTKAIMGSGGSGGGLIGWIGSLLGFGNGSTTFTSAGGISWNPSMNFPEHHAGGIAGDPGVPNRRLSAALLIGAPRLHSGLAPDEFPAILQSGERVLNRRETAAYGQSNRAQNVTVNVDNQTGMPISKDNVSVTQSLEGTVVGIVLKNYARGGDIWKMIRGGKNG